MRTAVLREFGVPCAEFDATGALRDLSPSAADLLGEDLTIFTQQAAMLARDLLACASVGSDRRDRAIIEVPCAVPGLVLRLQVLPRDGGVRLAVALLLPGRTLRVSRPQARWGLSPREHDVAREIARGASTKEIAKRLRISVHTVRRHSERVFTKLGVQSRTQVVVLFGASAPNQANPASSTPQTSSFLAS